MLAPAGTKAEAGIDGDTAVVKLDGKELTLTENAVELH